MVVLLVVFWLIDWLIDSVSLVYYTNHNKNSLLHNWKILSSRLALLLFTCALWLRFGSRCKQYQLRQDPNSINCKCFENVLKSNTDVPSLKAEIILSLSSHTTAIKVKCLNFPKFSANPFWKFNISSLLHSERWTITTHENYFQTEVRSCIKSGKWGNKYFLIRILETSIKQTKHFITWNRCFKNLYSIRIKLH